MFKACIGLNCARQIDFIDRRGCQLVEVPDEIYRHESYLEELLLDSNSIHELPPKLFRLTNLRRLSLSENDIMRLPPMIANFSRLLELDISKNCIEEIPSNLQFCRSLSYFDCSCNPLMRIPDCITNVTCLTQLFLNDVGLPALPREIGNLQNLIILEARENLLRRVPLSIGELKKLERLDLGNNEIEALPSSMGFLQELVELWLDCNCLSLLPEELSNLSKLTVLDVTKNKLERLPSNFACLVNLNDLHASENCIEVLPDDFGCLKSLTQLKLDLNHLMSLPDSIGNIPNLIEVFLFENMLESIPPSLFSIPTLNMLNLDRNHLIEIPSNVGQCKSLHILSLRENDITFLPEEIGQLTKLRVLDVSGNRIANFPLTLSNLSLDALWVSGSQLQPLVSLQQVPHPENPDKRVLTCQFLPQKGQYGSELDYEDGISDEESDGGGFQRPRAKSYPAGQLSVAFEPGTAGLPPAEDASGGKLVRFPTPFRKDLKNRHKKPKLDARPRTTVFRKGSMDDLTIHAVDLPSSEEPSPALPKHDSTDVTTATLPQLPVTIKTTNSNTSHGEDLPQPAPLSGLNKMQGVMNLSADYLGEENKNSQSQEDKKPAKPRTKLKTIEVAVELLKDPNRGLGFSIAGGKGSTPAYEDVDESVFVTRIIRGGAAEKDGRLRLGDKVLSVNNQDMTEASHMQAVTALRNSHKRCILKVSREVLIVLPDNASFDEDSMEGIEIEGEVSGGRVKKSTESLQAGLRSNESLPASSVVTEESTGQRVEPVREPNHKEPRSENESQNTGEGEKTEVAVVEAAHKRTSSNVIGEAVLLDSDDVATTAGLAEVTKDGDHKEEIVKTDSELSLGILDTEMDEVKEDDKNNNGNDNGGERKAFEKESDRSDSGLGATTNSYEETVVLDRSIPTLGMSIVGGVDYSCKLFGCGNPGIYISKVSEGGSAAATGKIKIGDKILKVNGVDMESVTHEEAVMCLVSQEGNIELLVRHEPPPPGLQEIIINKSGNKLGVSIKGGGPESVGNPFDPSDEGIFISKVSKGGVAESDGRLQVGQRILEVDGNSLLGATHVEAVHILRQTGNVVKLLVCDGFGFYNRQGVIRPFDKDLRTGSMELLDIKDTRKHANVKRTRSTASSDPMRSPFNNKKAGSVSEFTRVLADLTKYQEQISSILPEKNEALQHTDTLETQVKNEELEETIELKGDKEQTHISVVAEINEVIDDKVVEVELQKSNNEEVKLDESTNSNSNSNIDSVGDADSSDHLSTTQYLNESIGLHRRDNANEVARQRAEKQEELKSIISEVFSDLDEWEILGKVSDIDKEDDNHDDDDEAPTTNMGELIASPPSASELSESSVTPVDQPQETVESDTEPSTDVVSKNSEDKEKNNIVDKENSIKEVGVSPVGVSPDLTIVTTQQSLLRGHTQSVPPTPTKPMSYQREWSVERPLSAQGSIDKIQTVLTQKPANLKAPEKLSFKDKLALHQKKVQTVSKKVEDELKLKRRSWAPVPSMGSGGGIAIPFKSHSNNNSPTVSPTHRLFSSMSSNAPAVKVNKTSVEREQMRLTRHTTSPGHTGERSTTPSSTTDSKPNSVSPSIPTTTTHSTSANKSSDYDDAASDIAILSPASDPPLTDSSTTPTSLTENEFVTTVAAKDFSNSTNTTKLSIDLENNSLLSNNQN